VSEKKDTEPIKLRINHSIRHQGFVIMEILNITIYSYNNYLTFALKEKRIRTREDGRAREMAMAGARHYVERRRPLSYHSDDY
jgi:hypothetical protein